MTTPADHLPSQFSKEIINELLLSIGFPKADRVSPLRAAAQYHSIYRVEIPASHKSSHTNLILRVSGHHIPTIKTENEVGVMSWISRNTSIPIPDLVAYDATRANPLGYEYTLLSHSPGLTLSDVYPSLGERQIEQIFDQLIDVISQLHQHEWDRIGGLRLADQQQQSIVVSRVLDETFWQTPDIERFWPPGETVDSLNIRGPYSSYVDYISAQVLTYIRLIRTHDSMSFLRELIPRLEAFVVALHEHEQRAPELNRVKLRLAHKDLHMANVLYDVPSGRLTAILDWEFSGVVPMTLWDPRRAFLWNARDDGEESRAEKRRLVDRFARRCEERGLSFILRDAAFASSLQESMQRAADYLRSITEVAPRGQRADLVPHWVAVVEESIAHFGV